jgi:hypothetical protein
MNEHPKRGVGSVTTTNNSDYNETENTKTKANKMHDDNATMVSTNIVQVTTQVTNAWQMIALHSAPPQ